MNKFSLFVLLFFLSNAALSQIEYCSYFRLQFEETEVNGKRKLYVEPELKQFDNDPFSSFVQKHQNRFEYILYNRIDSIAQYAKLYPDTIRIDSAFCRYLLCNQKINTYLNVLSNNSQTPKLLFSLDEMMLIASRFFLCDKVNERDSSVSYHICIGINGQKELKSKKDFTVLEAFCFEAIFDKINQDGTPDFVQKFRDYIYVSSEKYKRNFISSGLYLQNVKNDCYGLMEKDSSLAETLLQFYKKNQENLGFVIAY